MKKILSLILLTALCVAGAKADETLFKMDVIATSSQKTEAGSTSDAFTINSSFVSCSGSAYSSHEYYLGQSNVTYINVTKDKGADLRFTLNISYLKVVLTSELKANDVISFESAQNDTELGFSTSEPKSIVSSPTTSSKSYKVTTGDGICGQTTIYINRATNQNAGFASLSITRPATVTEKNTVSKLLSVGSLTEGVNAPNGGSVTEGGITLYGNVSTYTGTSYPSFSIANERTFEDGTKAKNLIYLNGAPNGSEINRCIKFTVDHPCIIKFYGAATGDGGRSLNYCLDEFKSNASQRTTIDGSNSAAKGTVAIGSLNLDEGHDVYVAATNGYNVFCIKVIYDNWNVPVSELGWASLYVTDPIAIPEGVKAYYAASANTSTVSLKEITGTIPANTGVIVKAAKGYYDFNVTVAPSESYNNLFSGFTEATPCEANTCYVLSGQSTADAPVFGLFTGTTLGANKAYLDNSKLPSQIRERNIAFTFEDYATAVDAVKTTTAKGAQVKKVVCNGKIVFKTINGTFNIAGGRIK